MEPAAWGFVGSLLGAIVGAGTSVLTTAINTRHSLKLQAAGKEWEKTAKFSSFQQDTLLTVQSSVQTLTRLMAKAHLAHRRAYSDTGKWAEVAFESGLDGDLAEANRALSCIVERVADDDLRRKIKEFHHSVTAVYMSKSPDEARRAFVAVGLEYAKIMERLGSTLRGLY